jgi:hypothetical protein
MMMAGLAKAGGIKNVTTAHNKPMSEGRKVLFIMMEMIFGFISFVSSLEDGRQTISHPPQHNDTPHHETMPSMG